MGDPGRIGAFDARQVGRHVGDDHVDRPPGDQTLQLGEHRVLAEVALHEGHALDRLEVEHVERDDGAVQRADGGAAGASLLRRELAAHVLAPGAGRRAQVDDELARLQQVQLLVDLLQLVGGARAIALFLRQLHVRDRSGGRAATPC